MQSYRSNAENPWNLFISHEGVERTECKFDEVKSTGYVLENFLTSAVPVSFTRSQNVVRCDLCKILVTRNRYKQHYEDRHRCDDSTSNTMIPFDENASTDEKSHKIKKIKRNRKKRANLKEKIEFFEKKKCKNVKVRPINKRHHSTSFLDSGVYFGKTKKLKLDNCDIAVDKKGYFATDEGFMSSSPKLLDDNFYRHNLLTKNNLSLDVYSLNDGVYCSNGSVNRTCSDSSTPPPLSLGTLQTLSSPSSLNILNDPSSVVTEHYFLSSNDLTPERSGVSCKYQIDSLPWENFPSMPIKDEDYNNQLRKHPKGCFVLPLEMEEEEVEDENGEVERAVQSITNLSDSFQTDMVAMQKQMFIKTDKSMANVSNVDDGQQKLDLFNSDEASMIDCFLDEVLGGSSINKDHLMEYSSCSSNVLPNINVQSNLMEEFNNLSEYQMDSNFLNNFSSDYDEKFETLINNTINEFVTQSPQNICSTNLSIDKRKSYDCFDPLKHCGVVASNGVFCHRSLLCKLHTMPQKRLVTRPESLTTLIKVIRDLNKSKRLHKKQAQFSDAFKSCNSSKTSSDSFNYNCSSTRSTEEAGSFLENRLSTPDLDVSNVINVINSDCASSTQQSVPLTISTGLDPKPLVKSIFHQETVVNGNRSLIATKSLLWKNRPKSKCQQYQLNQYPFRNISNNVLTIDGRDNEVIHLPSSNGTHNNLAIKNSNEMPQTTFVSNYSLSCVPNEGKRQSKLKLESTINDNLQAMNVGNNKCYGIKSMNSDMTQQQTTIRLNANTMKDIHRSAQTSVCVTNNDLTLSDSNNFSASSTVNNSSNMSSGFFNINPQFISTNDLGSVSTSSAATALNTNILFNDPNLINGGFSLANISNNGNNMTDVSSSGNKFISILDEGGTASGSILYPVRNTNQIMMVMNKNNRFFNDSTELFNDNLVSVNQNNQQLTSMPLNSFLALKQNTGQYIQQDGHTSLSTPQIVSISPVELQRLSDSFTSSLGGQMLTADCDKTNNIIYQLNQPQTGANNFVPSSNIESNNMAKPLTVQSSTANGLTQKFIILPDGTISAFAQQPPNNVKASFNQSSMLNRTSLQHPLFNQLSNYGQNQTYFINNDKIIIAPTSGVTSNSIAQQILMPQIINQADGSSHSSPALTFIHPHHPHTSKLPKMTNKAPQHNLPTQIPVDSSQQKVSFQIQTQNSYPNQIPNTFFITAAPTPTGSTGIPMKQQIFVQASDQIASDIPFMDSSGYFDGNCNNQNKSIAIMDSMTCNTDLRQIGSSSQEFDLVNHVLNPQSIVIQQPSVNRYPSKGTNVSGNICRPSSVDLNNGNVIINSISNSNNNTNIEGAHSTLNANGQQHIVVNNTNINNNNNNNNSSEQFAQSQLKFSQRHMPTSTFINAAMSTHCPSVSGASAQNLGTDTYKAVPPPLVISQQLLNQSVTSHLRQQKSISDHSYQQTQQSQQISSQLNQLVMDDSQFANEYMIVQSMIA